MFVHLFDVNRFDRAVAPDDVDSAVRIAQSHRTIALPDSLERVVPEARNGAGRFQAFEPDEVSPERELPNDV